MFGGTRRRCGREDVEWVGSGVWWWDRVRADRGYQHYHPRTINHAMIVYPLPIESLMGPIKLTPLLRIEARNEGRAPRQRFFLLVAAMEAPAPWTFGGREHQDADGACWEGAAGGGS